MVDAKARWALMSKIYEAKYKLLKELASNNYQWLSERSMLRKVARVLLLDPITNLVAQMTTLSK